MDPSSKTSLCHDLSPRPEGSNSNRLPALDSKCLALQPGFPGPSTYSKPGLEKETPIA
jgi:hypothetical protein